MGLMVYPAAFMANTFAMMLVMIGLSLFGKPELAADFGLIHGATVALFFSFSGNARSLILAESGEVGATGILRLRLLMLPPLGILAFILCIGVVGSGWIFVLLLVVRRATEWLAEIFLSEQELRHQGPAALQFLLVQAGLSLLLLLALLDGGVLATPVTMLWALSPLLACLNQGLLGSAPRRDVPLFSSIRLLLPHFGSTAVIGVSVYVFRLFILLVAGKEIAGDLFSAFALGGILGAVFSQALGPTLVRHEQRAVNQGRLLKIFNLTLKLVLLAGVALVAGVWSQPHLLDWTQKSQLFWLAVGCSLVGGVVMVFAQRIRLRILQDEVGGDVFGSDILANILLVACIPFMFYGLGVNAMALLYLLGASLSWLFYASERRGFLPLYRSGWFGQRHLLMFIVVAIFLPVFFQLQGGLFTDRSSNFSSDGILALLPIPVSVLVCYLGMVLLGGYSRARLALLTLFFVFVGMLLTSILLGLDATGEGRQKLILLIQYILPMFALVLGQQYGAYEEALTLVARAAMMVLLVVLPLQLLVTLLNGDAPLSPSAYFFSIYQHLQYVPLLFAAAFVLGLFSLWGHASTDRWLSLLTFLMGVYVVLSWSVMACLLFALGVIGFVIQKVIWGRNLVSVLGIPVLGICGALLGTLYVHSVWQAGAMTFPAAAADLPMQFLEGWAAYLERWKFYVDGIFSTWTNALLGHVKPLERGLYPSALNYYLDFAYNFGLLGLLPLMLLTLYTLLTVFRAWRNLSENSPAMGLALVVTFMLMLDSSFKVGLRQPYSGIIMFFFWGLLLAVIPQPSVRTSPAS
ncbi:MAG: hypothetical protein CVU32_01135 [Betaproteobacteria bacterium HGW-Betaproteobacteria-5]|nr:MAG: hypothetical protein CVU32_01135 [Betaproteobacteria bacterium HGW-Betaproteobacteria-5]PKO30675.1 MAG: hypothetical protein CVU34_19300 [Betaproteobacteria bacterium HGW-Betaproteobacteria-7]